MRNNLWFVVACITWCLFLFIGFKGGYPRKSLGTTSSVASIETVKRCCDTGRFIACCPDTNLGTFVVSSPGDSELASHLPDVLIFDKLSISPEMGMKSGKGKKMDLKSIKFVRKGSSLE